MKYQRLNATTKLLLAVFAMHLIGFIVLVFMKYNMDVISVNFRNRENDGNRAILCVQKMKTEIYYYDDLVTQLIYDTEANRDDELRKKMTTVHKDMEVSLNACSLAFRQIADDEEFEEFNHLHEIVLAYLNSMEAVVTISDYYGRDVAAAELTEKTYKYVTEAQGVMTSLEQVAQEYLKATENQMGTRIKYSRITFGLGVFSYFVGTIVCMSYCWKIMVMQDDYRRDAEIANEAKSAFLSNMSHEIRTPINAIIGMNEMIIRNSEDAQVLEYADRIRSSSNGLLGLINDILDFSKIEAGKMELVPDNYELKEAIIDVWSLISPKIEEKDLTFSFNGDPDIPMHLYGDAVRIKQILVNLLTNAAKYTKEGGVTLQIRHEVISEEIIKIRFSIIDTGMGINPEEIDKLTKPFQRLDERKNSTIEGTGLGLSIVNNLLAMMNSKLEIESVYGQGSTFSFTIAQKVTAWEKLGVFHPQEYKRQEVTKTESLVHASKAKILAVDDNEMNRLVIKELLKRTGVQLDLATGGRQSVDMAKMFKYDLILMDHRMPEVDGVEALHMIQREGLNTDTPVIIVTANALSGAEEMYRLEGFASCIKKPIEASLLEKVLLDFLPPELLDTEDDLFAVVEKEAGIKACGNQEIYEKVVKDFVFAGKMYMNELTQLLSDGDIENYTIKVHALKSTARLIGANRLSDEAKELEARGDAKDMDYIQNGNGPLLIHYQAVLDTLKKEYSFEENHPNGEISFDYLKELLEAIVESCDAFDFDSVDRAVEELNKYDLPEVIRDMFGNLQTAAFNLESEQMVEIINQMREQMNM